ncbi:MAG: hypothetical protein HY720_25830 [Planctomycetes bacterium]|nr:hypothetical protein [Planctomycetota bacterium]
MGNHLQDPLQPPSPIIEALLALGQLPAEKIDELCKVMISVIQLSRRKEGLKSIETHVNPNIEPQMSFKAYAAFPAVDPDGRHPGTIYVYRSSPRINWFFRPFDLAPAGAITPQKTEVMACVAQQLRRRDAGFDLEVDDSLICKVAEQAGVALFPLATAGLFSGSSFGLAAAVACICSDLEILIPPRVLMSGMVKADGSVQAIQGVNAKLKLATGVSWFPDVAGRTPKAMLTEATSALAKALETLSRAPQCDEGLKTIPGLCQLFFVPRDNDLSEENLEEEVRNRIVVFQAPEKFVEAVQKAASKAETLCCPVRAAEMILEATRPEASLVVVPVGNVSEVVELLGKFKNGLEVTKPACPATRLQARKWNFRVAGDLHLEIRELGVSGDRAYALGVLPVTNKLFEALQPGGPAGSATGQRPDAPRVRISPNEAAEWCGRLYECLKGQGAQPQVLACRLPAAEEWRLMCEHWEPSAYLQHALYKQYAFDVAPELTTDHPNPLGFSHVLGTVWEIVMPPQGKENYPALGGCWASRAEECTPGSAIALQAGEKRVDVGFRVLVEYSSS